MREEHMNSKVWGANLQSDLSEIGQRAFLLNKSSMDQMIELYIVCADAREAAGREKPYHQWAFEYLNWSEDVANKSLRIGRWLKLVRTAHQTLIEVLPRSERKLDDLRRIPIEYLEEFKNTYPSAFIISDDEKCSMRDLVNKFLSSKGLYSPPATVRQQDFFQQLGLPAPDRIDAFIIKHRQSITPDTARFYGTTFLNEAVDRCAEMKDDEVKVLIQDLQYLLDKATHGTSHHTT